MITVSGEVLHYHCCFKLVTLLYFFFFILLRLWLFCCILIILRRQSLCPVVFFLFSVHVLNRLLPRSCVHCVSSQGKKVFLVSNHTDLIRVYVVLSVTITSISWMLECKRHPWKCHIKHLWTSFTFLWSFIDWLSVRPKSTCLRTCKSITVQKYKMSFLDFTFHGPRDIPSKLQATNCLISKWFM